MERQAWCDNHQRLVIEDHILVLEYVVNLNTFFIFYRGRLIFQDQCWSSDVFCVFNLCCLLGQNNRFLVARVPVLLWTFTGLEKRGATLLPMPLYLLESNSSASAVRGKSSQEISYCPFMGDGAAAHPIAHLPVTHLCSPRELPLGKSCSAFQRKLTLAAT